MDNNEPPKTTEITFPLPDSAQRISNTSKKPRVKIVLQPGHSPLDWAQLKSTRGSALAGVPALQKYTSEQLKLHNTEQDCYIALMNKVFNVTSYFDFHPGGKRMLMSVAGKDGTVLFQKYHAWVNADYLLDKCLVGFLVQ